ncbi:uncharacterized protein LOC126820538 isoform X2 [Patella vulgata]|uniref:uncharacterized protein LOC126820538 isoform X2 n=1 Tax=Patella vulgata TaxID=6465 RepID=UPI0024A9AA94|nr:uncharacterized protein LOC126820538 isoform X2 [Patella vulgata]
MITIFIMKYNMFYYNNNLYIVYIIITVFVKLHTLQYNNNLCSEIVYILLYRKCYIVITFEMKKPWLLISLLIVIIVVHHLMYRRYCPNNKWFANPQLENNITVVTAYFNIGEFQKGLSGKYTPDLYVKWMTTFQYLINPLVVYVDEQKMADIFKDLRKGLKSVTKIIVLDRKYMWSFGLKHRIGQIFSSKSYPRFYPNTVVPEYACANHAKYECLEKAIQEDYFSTAYFSWLDIGYFRDIVSCTKDFTLVLPDCFDQEKISFTQIYEFTPQINMSDIFLKNRVWVGGGMNLAKKEVSKEFVRLYRNSVDTLMQKSLMSTDQQVIYSIYSNKGRAIFNPTVEVQPYRSNDWFYLGFLCHRSYNKSSFRED